MNKADYEKALDAWVKANEIFDKAKQVFKTKGETFVKIQKTYNEQLKADRKQTK